MTTVIKTTTKRAVKLMEFATKNAANFITGNPLKVNKYGVRDGKVVFTSYTTTRGIEELFSGKCYDCLADCLSDIDKMIILN